MTQHRFLSASTLRNLLLALSFLATLHGSPLKANDAAAEANRTKETMIVSPDSPALAIRLADDALHMIGRHSISIDDKAAGERIVYGETEGDEVKRLFIVQFEAFHADNDETYNYDLTKSPEVAGYRWRSNAYAFDMVASRSEKPAGEAAGTAALLEKNEYTVPQDWLMWRSLTITDDSRKGEVILFYIEFGRDHGMTLTDIYAGDDETPAWQEFQKGLESRANAAFELAPVLDGIPNTDVWAHIPVSAE